MTDEEIAVEYEAFLCAKGEPRKECPKCGLATFRDQCPRCGPESEEAPPLTGDKEVDEFLALTAAGKDASEAWEKLTAGGFEPVAKE